MNIKLLICISILAITISFGEISEGKRSGVRVEWPWPHPQHMQTLDSTMSLTPQTFKIISNLAHCDIIDHAIERYKKLLFSIDCSMLHHGPATNTASNATHLLYKRAANQLHNLTVNIESENCEKYPYENMDESYSLHVNSPKHPNDAVLTAKTIWGALRGLETFSHLMQYDNGKYSAISTTIDDFPTFNHRGLMIDTSRHFQTKDVLKMNLDAMSYNKMNVFHWHMTDDNSFPYVSKVFPTLSEKASYNAHSVYTHDDIAEIIEYARLRGIRVIVEFDSPVHLHSWGRAHPEILTPCGVEKGPINVASNITYTFLENLFSEVASLFPDQYIHLGGDEVSPKCWWDDPNVRKFMTDHHIPDLPRLEEYYYHRLADIMKKLNKKFIWWEDPIGTDKSGLKLDANAIIQVWKPMSHLTGWINNVIRISNLGYKIILSSPWYLSNTEHPREIDLRRYYEIYPRDINAPQHAKDLIIGGEACIWTEVIASDRLMDVAWPLASTVAERLWSPEWVKSWNNMHERFEDQRCRMRERGIKLQAVSGIDNECHCA